MAAAMLRSVRILRSLHSLSRFTAFHRKRSNEFFLNILSECVNVQRTNVRLLAVVQPVTTSAERDSVHKRAQFLDKVLYRMDLDVRRTGRTTRKDVEDVLREIKKIGTATSIQSLLLIRCCGSLLPDELPSERNQLLMDAWNTLQKLECPLDISHYNALLKAYLENGHRFSPTEILSEIESKGLQPNRVTYQRLIARYCEDGDMTGTSTILEYMKNQGIPINEAVFNSLITGHMRAGDVENAKNILEIMRNAQLLPTSATYTALIRGFAEKGDIDSMKEALQEAERNEVHLLDKDYLDIIEALAISGHAEFVDEIIPKLRQLAGYNQDCLNMILTLVNQNQEDVGYKLLKTMPRPTLQDGTSPPVGLFFIRQLVKQERPAEKILQICSDLKEQGLNDVALSKALEAALMNQKIDLSLRLLSEVHKEGLPIRCHYFWPILAIYRDLRKDAEIYRILKLMVEYGCPATFETYTDYCLPGLNMDDIDTIVQKVKDIGQTVSCIINPLVQYLLMMGKPKEAAAVIEKYPVRINGGLIMKVLASAYKDTYDVTSVMKVLRHLYDNPDVTADQTVSSDWGGRLLLNYLFLEKNNVSAFEKLLHEMHKERIALSHSSIDGINRTLKGNVPSADILEQLGTSTLRDVSEDGILHPRDMNIEDLQNHLIELKSKGLNTRGVLRRLLLLHCRAKNLEKAEEIKSELEMENFAFTPAMYAQLIDLYTSHGKLEDALRAKASIEQLDPNFVLDDYKALNLAILYVKQGDINSALSLLDEHVAKFPNRRDPSFLSRNVSFLLKAASQAGNIEGTKRLFDHVVLKHKFGVPNTWTLGPIIQAYLMNDDLNGAVEEFEKMVKQHRCTPWKAELTRRLISLEDTDRLQKVTDLSIDVHGEMNTLSDLAVCFIETGHVKEARKIFETPGLRARQGRLDDVCERFIETDQIKELESLVSITRDLFDVDRDKMYYYLIRGYAKQNDVQKALSVWTSMQEDDVQPTARTLNFLGNFLKRNNETVPFIIPNVSEEQLPTSDKSQLTDFIQKGDMDRAMELKQKIDAEGDQLGVLQTSQLINGLLKRDRLQEATNIMQELLSRGFFPMLPTLKFLLNRLARAGDIDTMEMIGKKLPTDHRKAVSFDNLLTNAYMNAGKHLEVIEKLENSNLENKDNIPLGGILGLLHNYPELEDRISKFADKCKKELGYTGPLNMVWMNHMQNGNYEKADAVFQATPEFKESLLFSGILRKIRESGNESLARKLVEVVNSTNILPRAKGIAYGGLINVLINNEKVNEALAVLEGAVKNQNLKLEDFNRPTLVRLEVKSKEAGLVFPYQLPSAKAAVQDTSSSESSSDSSDEEVLK